MSDKNKELLELAKQDTDEEIRYEGNPDVVRFVKKQNIQPGNTMIPAGLIYFEYKKHKFYHRKAMISKDAFFKSFINMFERKMHNNMVYYMLDPEQFDMSEEGMFKYYRSEHREKKRKKNNKKSGKKSGSKTSIQSKKKS